MLKGANYRGMIPAKDIQTTRRFYEDVLGLSVHREAPAGITYQCGDGFVDLYPTQFAGTAQHTIGGWAVDDVRATMVELRERGVTFEEYDLPGLKTENGVVDLGGELAAWFKDPEGNILAIAQTTEQP